MSPDLSKPEASALFEAFGFGAINLISTVYYYRTMLDSPQILEHFQSAGNSSLGLLIASLIIFISYVIGLAIIELGSLVVGRGVNSTYSTVTTQVICIVTESEYLWEVYKATNRKIRFVKGVAGTSVWFAAQLILSLTTPSFWMSDTRVLVWAILTLPIAILVALCSKLRAKNIQLSFEEVLQQITNIKNSGEQ